ADVAPLITVRLGEERRLHEEREPLRRAFLAPLPEVGACEGRVELTLALRCLFVRLGGAHPAIGQLADDVAPGRPARGAPELLPRQVAIDALPTRGDGLLSRLRLGLRTQWGEQCDEGFAHDASAGPDPLTALEVAGELAGITAVLVVRIERLEKRG